MLTIKKILNWFNQKTIDSRFVSKTISVIVTSPTLKYYYCINALSPFIASLRMTAYLILSYDVYG